MLVRACEQLDPGCFQKRVFNPYFQVFPSWEARALAGGGAVQPHGERGPKKAKSEDGGGGGAHRQFPEETQAVKGVKRPP